MTRAGKKDPSLPHRLAALLRLQPVEDAVHAAVRATLSEWLPHALTAVLGEDETLTAAAPNNGNQRGSRAARRRRRQHAAARPLPDPDRITRADAILAQATETHLVPAVSTAFDDAFTRSLRNAPWTSDRPHQLKAAALEKVRAGTLSALARDRVATLVHDGIEHGLSHQAIAVGVHNALSLAGPDARLSMFAVAHAEDEDAADTQIRRLTSVPLTGRDAVWREQMDELRTQKALARAGRVREETQALETSGAWDAQSLTIARTATMGAVNGGTLAGMQTRAAVWQEVLEKVWMATDDARTRETHAAADGQRQGLDQPFTVGGAQLMTPGDVSGPPEETVNCRCCMLELEEGEEDPRNPGTGSVVAMPSGAHPELVGTVASAGTLTVDDDSSSVSTASRADGARMSAPTKPKKGVNPFPPKKAGPAAATTAPKISLPGSKPSSAPVNAPAAAVLPVVPSAPVLGQAWNAIIAVEGTDAAHTTSDRRRLLPDSLTWRDLPLPLMFQTISGMGHDNSVAVGRIETITRDGDLIRAAGSLLLPNAADPDDPIAKCIDLVGGQVVRGVSIDLDDMVIDLPAMEQAMIEDGAVEIGPGELAIDGPDDDVLVFSQARLMAVTVVATPALAQCQIALGTDPVSPLSAAPPLTPDDKPTSAPAPVISADVPATPQPSPDGMAAKGVNPFPPTKGAAPPAAKPAAPAAKAPAAKPAPPKAPPKAPPAADPPADPPDTPDTATRADGTVISVGDDVMAIVTLDGTDTPVDATVASIDGQDVTLTLNDGTSATVDVEKVFPDPDSDSADDAPADPAAAVVAAGMNSGISSVVQVSREVLLAAAPNLPPAAWFADPQLPGPTALQIDADSGRVYGHLAVWGTCHTGIRDVCTTAPYSASGYAYFAVGEVLCDDGSRVPTGRITLGGGHADPRAGYTAAMAHYDDAGSVVADAAAGEDSYGIWLAGALRPGLSDQQLRQLRASPLSGDWRRIKGNLELMGALAVNVPGFPVPRVGTANGQQVSLAASGVLHPTPDGPLVAAGALDVSAEVSAALGRHRRAARLAVQAGCDPRSRAKRLAALVHAV